MGPLPYPHRATYLASTLLVPDELEGSRPFFAQLLSVIVFDHFLRHPVVTLGDHDDERLVDDYGRLLDAHHPQVEDSIEWLFRVARRHEILWFELAVGATAPQPVLLRSRLPSSIVDTWVASPGMSLSEQLDQCLAQWLGTRRLPAVPPLLPFDTDDLRAAGQRLAKVDSILAHSGDLASVPDMLTQRPARLTVPYLRALGEMSRDASRSLDPIILQLDPSHPVARRNRYVTALLQGDVDRRAILPVVADAPMYGKPHLSIWGEPFAADRPLENMGVRHQGIAASLMPSNAYACHNYSLQLAEQARREESYRWADRATVAAPQFGAAHLDCVRRLRQVGRPGQAFSEAQYRCREILDREASGKLPASDWQAPHHARLLIAFAHLDVGRIVEAIEHADDALAQLPDDPHKRHAFAWAAKRVQHWKSDPSLLARAYAWEGYHRADPGRAIVGLTRGKLSDDDDAWMLIDSLINVGNDDQAKVAYHHCAGIDSTGILGDGKARLAAAKALILTGDLDDAIDEIQIVELRRSQSRLEADINRLLRLAAIRPADDWDHVIARRLDRGAITLARLAARDLADFTPDLDTPTVRRALGDRTEIALDALWISELIGALPAVHSSASTIIQRLAPPKKHTLAAADALAQEWRTVLVPPAHDRDAHAAGAMLALGISIGQYLVAASRGSSPIAGAYRHIATEALHLVRRSRYQIDTNAIGALLRLVEYLRDAPEWLLDTWLLRIERALDLEAEHGAFLDGLLVGMPTVQRLLRGDERIGWEVRLAHDIAADPTQYEPAAMMFQRCVRAVEAGGTALAWSAAASAAGASLAQQLDVHSYAALANPTTAAPWLRLATCLMAAGRRDEGFDAACRGMSFASRDEKAIAIPQLAGAWRACGLDTPLDVDAAFDAGLAAASEDRTDAAIQHLRWANALDATNPKRANSLAVVLGRAGRGFDAIRILARHDRNDAPRIVGRVLIDAGREVDAVAILRYASRRFRSADDWAALAIAAAWIDNDPVAIDAGRRAMDKGSRDPQLLVSLATSMYRIGEFVDCESVAQLLITESHSREARMAGLHAMARALAGQGRHVDAHPYAKAAAELGPNGDLASELMETLERIVAQEAPPVRSSLEMSMERQAFDDLEAGRFDSLVTALSSPSWGIARAALAASEFRKDDESGIPVAPRALDAAVAILGRTEGATNPDAVLARIRALRIRDNAFIQIDLPPPLGVRYTPEDFEQAYADRDRRLPRAATAITAAR